MKIEFIALAALATTVSAIPLRIITLSGPVPNLHPSEVQVEHGHGHEHGNPIQVVAPYHDTKSLFHPCGKGMGKGKSPFTDLLVKLGFYPPHDGHGHGHEVVPGHRHEHEHEHDLDLDLGGELGEVESKMKHWKEHVEAMIAGKGGKVVPIMENGSVRILPFTEEDGDRMAQSQPEHQHGHGHHLRPYRGHHWRHRASSFGSRLQRALLNLQPFEAIALAFVLGAGIGSIMHLFFMLFLISIRRIRGGRGRRGLCRRPNERERGTKEERKEARRLRREARRIAKLQKQKKEVEEEVLPAYGEGEGDRLVEKA